MKRQRVKIPWDIYREHDIQAKEVYSPGLSTARPLIYAKVKPKNATDLVTIVETHLDFFFHPKVSLQNLAKLI